jgi:hypothetical protein
MTDQQDMFVFFYVVLCVVILLRFQTPKSSWQSFRFDSPKSSTFSTKPNILGYGLGKEPYYFGQGLGKDPALFEEVYNVDEGSGLIFFGLLKIFFYLRHQ